jgi:phosphoglycerol transferase MdoB-like AlkP superfamily enzyme
MSKNIISNLFALIPIITNSIIIFYLYHLEDTTCNCIRDWRHEFIKYIAMILIFIDAIVLFYKSFEDKISEKIKLYKIIISVINVLYCIFAFFYIGDLDKTNCICAVEKQKGIHGFLFYFWRYILLIFAGIIILDIIINITIKPFKS